MTLQRISVDLIMAHLNVAAEFPVTKVHGGMGLSERFRTIKANYENYQKRVDAGTCSWMDTNQYVMGDWLGVFTPIEQAAWGDIRCAGLPLWPQLPVGRFFVDFGNPVVKVVLECDGKEWHDERKDAERDRELNSMGWRVFRASGRRCKKVMPIPDDINEWSDSAQADFMLRRKWETLDGVIGELQNFFGREL